MKEQNNSKFLEDLVSSSLSKIEELSQSKTIIGNPIMCPNSTVIIPISKVTIGFVVGGGECNSVNKKTPYPTCGGSGGGVNVCPIGFIVNTHDEVKFIDVENKSTYQTILNLANSIISKMNNNNKGKKNEEDL